MKHLILSAAIMGLSAPLATAQVVEENDTVWGAGSITRDVAQNLDFLDITLTQGRSYSDIAGGFGVGGEFEGWRHASAQEVVNLINSWGFSPSASVPASDVADVTQSGNTGVDQLGGLVALVGGTISTSSLLAADAVTIDQLTGSLDGRRRRVVLIDFFGSVDDAAR